jgi:GDP-L-fucose synthase
MKVLITGANGFVGRHVVRELENNHELLIPDSSELNLLPVISASGVHTNNGWCLPQWPDGIHDTYRYLLTKGVDAVIHLAATCGGIGINADNPGRFIYENLQMGINVLEAARLAEVRKVVLLGSVCSYPKFARIPFHEEDMWDGYPEETNAPYGIAKKTIMEMGAAYSRQYKMNVTNLVPVNMVGEYDNFDEYSSHVIPALIKKFELPQYRDWYRGNLEEDGDFGLRGQLKDPYVELWGTGSASREFLYAGDCARAIGIALEKHTGPDPINLGTGKEITIKDLAILIKHLGGYDAEILWDESRPDGQPRRCLDTTRAKHILRWEATTSIERAICKTIDWYRENK